MAKKVKTWLTDDKEASAGREVEADQTVEFGLDGNNYEIDLCTKNATKIRADIEQWIQHARRVGGARKRQHSPARGVILMPQNGVGADSLNATQRKGAREWLRSNGHPGLGDRGRIPAKLLDEFHARPVVA